MHNEKRRKAFDATPGDGIDELPDVPGVYCILNRVSGHRYVGCTVKSMQKRAREHRSEMRRGMSSNMLMRKHLQLHGQGVFFFFALQECPDDGEKTWSGRLHGSEFWWVLHLASHDERYGYNAEAGHIRTPAALFRESERRMMRGNYPSYELLPGVDRYDPIHPNLLATWHRD